MQLKSGGELQKVKVKLSGDGVKMSHSNNLFVCSFALLDIDGQNILSSAGMICIFNAYEPFVLSHLNLSISIIKFFCVCFNLYSANHTVALVMGKEDHETLRESLANVISDVNKLIDAGKINVEGRDFELEFFLGSDYKVCTS